MLTKSVRILAPSPFRTRLKTSSKGTLMPPLFGSRYLFCHGVRDENGKLYLTEREPYRYRWFGDNRLHTVVEGDTLPESFRVPCDGR